jgi:predicted GNAT family N-acyltransferase
MMSEPEASFSIRVGHWEDDAPFIRIVRTAVFIQEQHVPAELEWDEFDAPSVHVLAEDVCGQPIGTARLLQDGHIGRMAVMKEWRRQGIGSALLQKIITEMIDRGMAEAKLNAQVSAIGFYQKFGFQVSGNEFMDAKILHVKMIRQL